MTIINDDDLAVFTERNKNNFSAFLFCHKLKHFGRNRNKPLKLLVFSITQWKQRIGFLFFKYLASFVTDREQFQINHLENYGRYEGYMEEAFHLSLP